MLVGEGTGTSGAGNDLYRGWAQRSVRGTVGELCVRQECPGPLSDAGGSTVHALCDVERRAAGLVASMERSAARPCGASDRLEDSMKLSQARDARADRNLASGLREI